MLPVHVLEYCSLLNVLAEYHADALVERVEHREQHQLVLPTVPEHVEE